MTYRIEKQTTGRYAILDGDRVVRDDLASNADAWKALDRLEGDNFSPSEARASWGFRKSAIVAPYAN